MNAMQLKLPNGTFAHAWQCGVCGLIYSEQSGDQCEKCCKCTECGKQINRSPYARSFLCPSCWGPYHARRDADRLARATEVVDYSGPVVIGDQYWSSPDDLLDELDADAPEFAHTYTIHHYQLDASSILEDLLENANVEDHDTGVLAGVKEFEDAVRTFNLKNSSDGAQTYWEEDSTHKVRIRTVSAGQEVSDPHQK